MGKACFVWAFLNGVSMSHVASLYVLSGQTVDADVSLVFEELEASAVRAHFLHPRLVQGLVEEVPALFQFFHDQFQNLHFLSDVCELRVFHASF